MGKDHALDCGSGGICELLGTLTGEASHSAPVTLGSEARSYRNGAEAQQRCIEQ